MILRRAYPQTEPEVGKANGTVRCQVSEHGGQPRVDKVTFTPDQLVKHGEEQFVAFVPQAGESSGFVVKLSNGRIDLGLDGFRHADLLSQAALCSKKVTVVVSPPCKGKCPELKALVVPAE